MQQYPLPGQSYADLVEQFKTRDAEMENESDANHIHIHLPNYLGNGNNGNGNGNGNSQPSTKTNPPAGTSYGDIYQPNKKNTVDQGEDQPQTVGTLPSAPEGSHYEIGPDDGSGTVSVLLVSDDMPDASSANEPTGDSIHRLHLRGGSDPKLRHINQMNRDRRTQDKQPDRGAKARSGLRGEAKQLAGINAANKAFYKRA